MNKDELLASTNCDVCGKQGVIGVACTQLGPLSLAYCKDCHAHRAEPLWLIFGSLEQIGGPANIREDLKEIESFKDGTYIKWDEIVKLYDLEPKESV